MTRHAPLGPECLPMQRDSGNSAAFNRQNQQGKPACWNLVSLDGREPTTSDWCNGHVSVMEAALLDEVLPFDDRIKAVGDFTQIMFEARRTTALAMAKAARS